MSDRQNASEVSDLDLFPLGNTRISNRVCDALGYSDTFEVIGRHQRGDWGDVTPADRTANEVALKNGTRIVSTYRIGKDLEVWVITEANRSVTTVLLQDGDIY
jgi:hypothetical protein